MKKTISSFVNDSEIYLVPHSLRSPEDTFDLSDEADPWTLQRVSHVKPLLELKQESNILTKIFDGDSMSIYLAIKIV